MEIYGLRPMSISRTSRYVGVVMAILQLRSVLPTIGYTRGPWTSLPSFPQHPSTFQSKMCKITRDGWKEVAVITILSHRQLFPPPFIPLIIVHIMAVSAPDTHREQIAANCVSFCHRDGGLAPLALTGRSRWKHRPSKRS